MMKMHLWDNSWHWVRCLCGRLWLVNVQQDWVTQTDPHLVLIMLTCENNSLHTGPAQNHPDCLYLLFRLRCKHLLQGGLILDGDIKLKIQMLKEMTWGNFISNSSIKLLSKFPITSVHISIRNSVSRGWQWNWFGISTSVDHVML